MSEGDSNTNGIPTFVALPVDAFEGNTLHKSEQYRVIKSAIIKTLSNGSLCIIDASDLNTNQDQQLQPVQNNKESIAPSNNDDKHLALINDVLNEQKRRRVKKPPSPPYKCPKCKEIFEKMSSYHKHMLWHRNTKKFKCDRCSAGYNVETNLKIHMAMHGEGKPTCPLCKVSFQRLASLKSHLMLHQVEELYTCEECAAEFEKEEELVKHFQSHINNVPENDSLICSYCNVEFDEHKKYKEHISHHIKVKKMVLSGKKSRKTHGNKVYPHACNVCLKSFSRVSLLERHLRVHSGERPFVCPHCNRGFNQKGTLQIHLSKHTGIKPFQCTLCSAKFNQKGNLRVHVEKTHTAPMPGVKTYKCSHCTCIFKKVASLNVHITKSHATNEDMGNISNVMNRLKELEEQTTITPNMKPIDREIAEQNKKVLNEIKEGNNNAPNTSYVRLAESFLDGTVRRYLVMQKKVNDVRWYICNYCNKEFKKPSDLIRHTRVHTREKPFVCKQCGASFSLKSTLFCHVKTHIDNNSYACVICTKKFSSVRSVNLHLRKHSDKQNQQFKCVICNKWFGSVQKAKLHNREAHGDQSEKDSIKMVMKQPLLHTPNGLLPVAPPKSRGENNGESAKQFQCHVCDAKFCKMPNLNRHMLLHNEERKFKCNLCFKSYCTAHALREHLLFHSGVKNHACKVCGKKYTTASLLKRHMITHSTHKPYVCPYCNKNFKSVMLCRKHMNVHKKEMDVEIHDLKNADESEPSLTDVTESQLNDTVPQEKFENNDLESSEKDSAVVTSQDKPNLVEEVANSCADAQIDQQFYKLAPNSVQIITDNETDLIEDVNQIQTIFINCEDLQLADNVYTQNPDAMFFSSLDDLQDANVFSIDSLNGDFDQENSEAFAANQTYNLNQIINHDQIISTNVADLHGKLSKSNSTPYYPQSELNLLFNLDSEFEANGCDLPNDNLNLPDIILNEVPLLDAPQETAQPLEDDKTKKKFSCDKCDKTFANKNVYSKHVGAHNGGKKSGPTAHQCCFCTKAFKKQSDLIRHIRTHTGEKPFACDKCDKKFSLKSTLSSHQRTHNPVSHKSYNCVVCNSFFTSKSSLKVHMTVHTGDKSHGCSFCSMKFRTAAHKKSHETNHHLNPSKKKTKNKVTNLLASVAMDALNQQSEAKNAEEDLENVFVIQEPFQFPGDPMNILAENNQNSLAEAGQLEPMIFQHLQSNFLLQENLIPSSLVQLDDGTFLNVKTVGFEEDSGEAVNNENNVGAPVEKPRNLECDVCHKKYASKDVLRKHKKIHGVNKKFPCSKCDKGFDVKEQLEKHEKTHAGYRPYSCMYCTNSFAKEHSLTTHMKRIHDISLKDNSFLLCETK